MEPVILGDDGWFYRDETVDVAKPIPCPIKTPYVVDRHGKLDAFRLGLDWKCYKSFDPSRFTVKDNSLTVRAQGTDPGSSAPLMFVAGTHRYEIEAEIELQGDVTAGMILIYNGSYFMGTGFDKDKRYRYRMGGASRGGGLPANTKRLWLRLRNDENIVTGQYSFDGVHWLRETWGMDCSGYNHNTLYEFQSVLPGLFVFGNGSAVFRHFNYRELK